MAKKTNLTLMSLAALLKLRNDISAAVSKRANSLKKELAALGTDDRVGRVNFYGEKKPRKGRVAAKYRNPKTGETWAGRGAQPIWLREAMKAGKKPDDFLIIKTRKKQRAKRSYRARA